MQLHLDTPGGMAGDMFVAALLDAFPEHEAGVIASIAAVHGPVATRCRRIAHNDGVLAGSRFVVEAVEPSPAVPVTSTIGHDDHDHRHHDHDHAHHHDHHDHGHPSPSVGVPPRGHHPWATIRGDLERAPLDAAVRRHAIAIFGHLAGAEGRVHGIASDEVAFHEVGAWDSIADIVAAAYLIAVLAVDRWTVGPLPLGSGFVATEHGQLPVPAPATALLLHGFTTIDDGIGGERVTPTGAAILRHLCGDRPASTAMLRILGRSGIGFGMRKLPGVANCVRVLVFDEANPDTSAPHRTLGVVEFEVDDQSPEDLAMGLDRLRAHPDIFDVVQMPAFGKKGRMTTHVRALARAEALDGAIDACFRETTTIGLRHHLVAGESLPRRLVTIEIDGRPVRVKVVDRPGGVTAKAEADDALTHAGHADRARLRLAAERMAVEAAGG